MKGQQLKHKAIFGEEEKHFPQSERIREMKSMIRDKTRHWVARSVIQQETLLGLEMSMQVKCSQQEMYQVAGYNNKSIHDDNLESTITEESRLRCHELKGSSVPGTSIMSNTSAWLRRSNLLSKPVNGLNL